MTFSDISNLNNGSDIGAYIYGLFIEGCKYDTSKGHLEDSDPNVMFV